MEDLSTIPLLSWDDFQHYLPPACVDAHAVRASLQASGVICDNRWAVFPKTPAELEEYENDLKEHEDGLKEHEDDRKEHEDVFTRMHAIFDAVVEECKKRLPPGRAQTLGMADSNSQVPQYDDWERTNDGTLCLLTGSDYEWAGIGVSKAFKTNVRDKYENMREIVWSLKHTMRDDPCRRFTFGITIENDRMRVWFCNRSLLFVCDAFDFITDVEKLIRIYSSFVFASPAELGWDPSIRVVPNSKPPVYEIDVYAEGEDKPVTYHSATIIWDYGAEDTLSRATRVFEATDPATGRRIAIKDIWRDDNSETEGAVAEMVFRKLDERGGNFVEYKQFFMGVLRHGDVRVHGETDHTLDLIMRGRNLPPSPGHLILRRHGIYTRVGHNQEAEAYTRHRIHYRIVFADVGTPIHKLPLFKERCQTIIGSLKGHRALVMIGYMHRDISVGNILCVRTSDGKVVGKLSDLEYIMAIDSDDNARNLRTGTLDFMSVEVDAMTYLFRSDANDSEDDDNDDNQANDAPPPNVLVDRTSQAQKLVANLKKSAREGELAFRHNPLHDIESYWWIMAWGVYTHVPTVYLSTAPTTPNLTVLPVGSWSLNEHVAFAREMFPEKLDSLHRFRIIRNHRELKADVLPVQFRPFFAPLMEARAKLVKAYKKAERPATGVNAKAFSGIHQRFLDFFEMIEDVAPDDLRVTCVLDLVLPVQEEADVESNRKRKSREMTVEQCLSSKRARSK
ncbi:hypothetical protein PLICRDRAFT_359821 [Plicaturopsis crispa FD-325 SS-3]|uniref:Fungal-type protein kinase domain-containing protein n=1 Tax=Plicaturopsis crispa FD-325 SS-3 TaxID=944288 RepID=A0A0C9SKT4_PLICR|nr:hypothetical protein PLICRDRAFT_359821 [Plicaturopsis crispa FD-325 SS-3]